MSHHCYVIADNEREAESKIRGWILSTPDDRRTRERWEICFKGEHDALALLNKHKPYEPAAQIWSIELTAVPVDVPRETSTAPDGSVLVKGYTLDGVETELFIPRDEAAELIERDKGFDMRVISNVYVKLGDLFDALGPPDVSRGTSKEES